MRTSYNTADYYRRRNEEKFSDMNTFRKASVIISVIFLILLTGVMIISFINISPSDLPTVVSVENYNSTPISYSEFMTGSLDANYEDASELEFSEVRHIFKVTLSDGQEYLVYSNPGRTRLKNTDYYICLETTFDNVEFVKAFESGENTVTVDITATVQRGSFMSRKNVFSFFTTSVEREITERIVENVTPTDSTPLTVYYDSEECSFIGREFEITYSDGRKVTDTVKLTSDPATGEYYELDRHPIRTYLDEENSEVWFFFYDYEGSMKAEAKPYPFTSIEITDCVLDEEYNISSLSYNVTRADGTTESYTKELFATTYFDYHIYDLLDGYELTADREIIYPKLFEDIEVEVTASIGIISDEVVTATFTPELPSSDCSCICHRNMAYSKYCYHFMHFVQDILNLSKECKCGITHRDLS